MAGPVDKSIAVLPNVRKLFIPDTGYMIFDADLSGADAQVVAWEADDADLKKAFRSGVKIHAKNAEDMFGDDWRNAPGDPKNKGTPKGKMYDGLKRGVHGTNYGARPRTLAINIGWTVAFAESFQIRWFGLHPNIREWQLRTDRQLQLPERKVSNVFGYHRRFFDRPHEAYTEALAWVPQSTIAEVCFRGALQLRRRMPWVEILLQVHDSVVFQVPFHRADEVEQLQDALTVLCPYPDPLTIAWKLTRSEKSWGDCTEIK